MRIVVLGLLVCTLFSCDKGKQNTVEYFDSKSFFETAALQLSAKHKSLEKELMFGDSSLTQQFDTVDWKKELQPFAEIDLLKNGYKGRFKVDTTQQSSTEWTIIYTSQDAKTDLKELTLSIRQPDNALRYFKARFNTDNTLYEATKELVYYTDSLFTISGSQQVQLGKNLTYSVTGRITEGR